MRHDRRGAVNGGSGGLAWFSRFRHGAASAPADSLRQVPVCFRRHAIRLRRRALRAETRRPQVQSNV
jgi:hypothetical protein